MLADELANEVENGFAEVVGLERFGDEGVRPPFIGAPPGLFLRVGREYYDGQLPGRSLGSDVIEDLPAIHSGETDVEDHQIGGFRGDGLETAGPVFSSDDLNVPGPEAYLDQAPDDGGIFHYQNSVTHCFHCLGVRLAKLSAGRRLGLRIPLADAHEVAREG